jgi:hypothetical protein
MTLIKQANLNFRNQLSPDGRLRISNQILQGDYKQHNDIAGGSFNTETIGTGAFAYENSAIGATELAVTTNLDAVIRQTYQWHNYFAGKPTKIELTASAFDAEANVIKRMGYFSSNTTTPFDSNKDGFYFENDGTTIRCKILRNGTEIFNQQQSSWDNQSELTNFDPADFNFYVIEFLYLGGAIANFKVLTEFGLTTVATYQHINVDANTFIKSPNQPVRYEIRSTGGAGTFNHICSDVVSEGFNQETGILKTHNNGSALVAVNTIGQRYALLGVRQALTRRNVVIDLQNIDVIAGSSDNLLWELIFGGTTTPAASFGALPFSNMEVDANAGGTHSGGVVVASGYIFGNSKVTFSLNTARRLGSYINGTLEEAFVCVTPLTSNANAAAAINWREFI